MSYKCLMRVQGHIIDSLILSKIMDYVADAGAKCKAVEVIVGAERTSTSIATISIEADDKNVFNEAVKIAQKHGAVLYNPE